MTLAELEETKNTALSKNIALAPRQNKHQIMVCYSSGCESINSKGVFEKFSLFADENLKVCKTGCLGLCGLGPNVLIYPGEIFYNRVKVEDVEEIVEKTKSGEVVERLLYKDKNGKTYRSLKDIPFFKSQTFVARAAIGQINPEVIEDYIGTGGYFGLYLALEKSREEIIDIVTKSGIRGRGGAGFPTGKKWAFARQSESDKKYVVCNADEGDPGAFMDRSIMESNPHAIIEALEIAGHAIGAEHGLVYIRAEYPLAGARLEKAIKDARSVGLLGKNIFGTSFCFDIEIKYGASAFVCGEETALLRSCEGRRGEPTKKPPYPAERGYEGYPTVINNVETLACIPQIILKGPDWFRRVGTDGSKGTKVFALSGHVNNTGLFELPMGTTINQIIDVCGGGVKDGKQLKAVLVGGPSGGCIPRELCDTEIDYESLTNCGAMMGSGGMIVLSEDACMVDIAKFFLSFSVGESCGKCTPCRIGNKRMLEILTKITEGKANVDDLARLEEIASYTKQNSLCGLGQTSPNPVLSTLRFFRDEYLAHINGHCPAGVCKGLVKFEIDKTKCIGCTACSRVCPTNAISGAVRCPHEINQEKCIKCGSCAKTCKFSAVRKV